MAVKIRMKRMGARHRPFYRMVVTDSRMPRDGRFIETLGSYNPIEKPVMIKVKEAKVIDWIMKGAEVSTTVGRLLKKTKTMEKLHLIRQGQKPKLEDELAVEFKEKPKKKKKKKEAAEADKAEPAPAAEAPAEEKPAEAASEERPAEAAEEKPAEEQPAQETPAEEKADAVLAET